MFGTDHGSIEMIDIRVDESSFRNKIEKKKNNRLLIDNLHDIISYIDFDDKFIVASSFRTKKSVGYSFV